MRSTMFQTRKKQIEENEVIRKRKLHENRFRSKIFAIEATILNVTFLFAQMFVSHEHKSRKCVEVLRTVDIP